MALIKFLNTATVQASSLNNIGASDRCDKNGGGQNLKKDQWLVECSQLMFKSANQIYGMKFKKIFNDSIRRK